MAFTSGFTIEIALNIVIDMMSEKVRVCESDHQQNYGFMYEDLATCESLQDTKDKFTAAIAMLPRSVLETGVTPIRQNNPICNSIAQPTSFENSTKLSNSSASNPTSSKEMADKALVNLDCYAYLTISPFAENTISTIGLTVPRGIGFSGKIRILDKFEAAVEGLVR